MIKNILKGFIIGIAKIVPGVSGSMMAISFGVYEEVLEIIADLKNINTKKVIFLTTLFLGIVSGICLFSKAVKYFLNAFYLPTTLLFIGLIIGGAKITLKEMSNTENGYLKTTLLEKLIFVLSFSFCILISFNIDIKFINFHNNEILIYFILGIIEAFSSIVPGISGTAIFMSLGYYDMIINFFSNIFHPSNLNFGIFFLLGIIVGIIILAKLITYLFTNYRKKTYIAVLGFMSSSIIIMFAKALEKGFNTISITCGFILMYLGYKFTIKMTNLL